VTNRSLATAATDDDEDDDEDDNDLIDADDTPLSALLRALPAASADATASSAAAIGGASTVFDDEADAAARTNSFVSPRPRSSNVFDIDQQLSSTFDNVSARPNRFADPTAGTDDSTRGSTASATMVSSPTSGEMWAMLPRFGFPPPASPVVEAAEARHLVTSAKALEACEQHWEAALRGVPLLAHADPVTSEPLRKLARKYGVPAHLRGIMWITLSEVAVKMEENEGFCGHVIDRFGLFPGAAADAIRKDMDRTFPEHPFFGREQAGYARLHRVLHALCWRNPLLEYCQSFNYLTAVLLLFLDDEEAAFWMVLHVIERLLPSDFYSQGLLGVRIDQAVAAELLAKHLPKLHRHFHEISFDVSILVPAWQMSLFVSVFPIATVVNIWDYMFTQDAHALSTVPMAVVLGMLKTHQDMLLTVTDACDVIVSLTKLAATTCDGVKLVRQAHDIKVQGLHLQQLRRKHRTRIGVEAAARVTELKQRRAAEERAAAAALDRSAAARAAVRGRTAGMSPTPSDRMSFTPTQPDELGVTSPGQRKWPGSNATDAFSPYGKSEGGTPSVPRASPGSATAVAALLRQQDMGASPHARHVLHDDDAESDAAVDAVNLSVPVEMDSVLRAADH
jgi:hypothetical protein